MMWVGSMPSARPALAHPGQHLVRVFKLCRVRVLGRQAVVDHDHHHIGLVGQFRAHVVMGFAGAQHPAAAMEIDDARLGTLARRAIDAHVDALDIEILDHEALRAGRPEGGADLVPGRALARQRPGRGFGRGQLGEFLVECEHALVDGKRGHGFVPGSKSVICTCDPAPMHVSRLLLPSFWPFSKPATATGESKPDPEGVAATDDRIERLVMALPDPVLVVAAGGKVVAANAHVRAALDADPLGHHLSATIRAPALLEAVHAAIGGAEAHRVELEMRVPLARSFDVHVAPLGGAALLVFRDLTREQQIERMRADFVANASHELRTPLASLLRLHRDHAGCRPQRRGRAQPVPRPHAPAGRPHAPPDRRPPVAVAHRDQRACAADRHGGSGPDRQHGARQSRRHGAGARLRRSSFSCRARCR